MPQDYYSLVTDGGLIKEAASNEPGGTDINLTEIAVGDGGGVVYDPVSSATALVNEVYRMALTHVVVDENNPNQLIVEGVLDETIGPFYIREVGIFDSNGDLFAIGKYPETFKPNLPSGSGKRLYIRMILGFANAPNVNLVINNDIALDPNFGTDVSNALAERLVKTNNLSDLDDVVSARSNLGLGSAAISNEASEYQKGIAQFSDQSEVINAIVGKVFDPAKLAGLFNGSSRSEHGYIRIPIKISGIFSEIIIQWGRYTPSANKINFPITFPNNLLQIINGFKDASYNGVFNATYLSTRNWSNSGFYSQISANTIGGSRPWCAIGY